MIKLEKKVNDEQVLKGAFESVKFGTGEHFSVAPTVDPTVVRVHLNKCQVRNASPVYKENKWCTSLHTRITIVE